MIVACRIELNKKNLLSTTLASKKRIKNHASENSEKLVKKSDM